jgi:hypothetical protein
MPPAIADLKPNRIGGVEGAAAIAVMLTYSGWHVE